MTTLRRKVLGDLRANARSFFAVWITIVLGLTFYGSTYPAGVGMVNSFLSTYDLLGYADFNARFAAAPAAEVLAALGEIDGVTAVEGRLVSDAGLELAAPDRITLRLVSVPDEAHPAVNDYLIVAGDDLAAPGQLLLLESFARAHGIAPGDTLQVWINDQPHPLTVAGLAFAPEYLVAGESPVMPFPQPSVFGVGFVRHGDLAAALGQDGLINDAALRLEAAADGEAVRAALQTALASYDLAFLYSRVQTASGGVIDANIRGNMSVAAFFSLMFLLISGLVMAVLLARLMEAEKRRIGTMRALGLSRQEALRHYLTYPLLISITGGVAGSLLGYASSFFVAGYFIQTLAGGSLPAFVNTPQWAFILFGAGITVALALLAAALPTWRASGTDPGLALRPAIPRGMGAQGRVTLPGLPLAAQQAVRNILRVPARTLNTLLGVLIGVTVILAASGTADSTLRMTRVQVLDGTQFDLQVLWAAPALAEPRQQQLAALPGVTGVEMVLLGPVTAHFADRALDTYALSIAQDTDFYRYETIAGEAAFASGDAVWIGHNLARVLGIGAGETITLDALGQTRAARVAGIVNQGIGSPVFVPAALMTSWTPLNAHLANAALLRTDPAQHDEVRRALAALDGILSVEDVALTNQDINAYMALWVNFSYIFQGFGYLLTLVVIFNTISINLHERREELAIMRAMGASLGEIARVITWETLGVVVISVLLALIPGWLALDWLIGNYDLDFFGMLNHIAPQSYLIAVAGVVAVVLLAEWLSLRGLRTLELGYLSKSLSS